MANPTGRLRQLTLFSGQSLIHNRTVETQRKNFGCQACSNPLRRQRDKMPNRLISWSPPAEALGNPCPCWARLEQLDELVFFNVLRQMQRGIAQLFA